MVFFSNAQPFYGETSMVGTSRPSKLPNFTGYTSQCPGILRRQRARGILLGMKSSFNCLADLAEAEFRGPSYNGKPFLKTLSGLDAGAAAFEASFEGYSAWSVALHVGWCTWVVARGLLDEEAKAGLGPWPWPVGEGGFVRLADEGEASWKATLAGLVQVHEAAIAAIRTAPEDRFKARIPEWNIEAGSAVAWLGSHYAYHNAQLRNMGVPGLGPAKRVY